MSLVVVSGWWGVDVSVRITKIPLENLRIESFWVTGDFILYFCPEACGGKNISDKAPLWGCV